jgi:DNA-directed RNA polymerase delta subunit
LTHVNNRDKNKVLKGVVVHTTATSLHDMITFKPKQVTKQLLAALPERSRDVLTKRYGLGSDTETYTLESIGHAYGITRERVRQIENHGLQTIQKSEVYQDHLPLLEELHTYIANLGGGVIAEHVMLDELAKDTATRNHLFFLMVLSDMLHRSRENPHYAHRWYTEKQVAAAVENALRKVQRTLKRDELIGEDEILQRFRTELHEVAGSYDDEVLKRWLQMSKRIGRNPLGDWGPADSPNIRVKGIRDYAYLAVKRHGSPMHFKEVAQAISELFGHTAHTATTHNELIKDDRFVLVGRGLYALTEWGYAPGVVKEVLRDLLTTEGPLTREEIIDKVRKERYVKDNTILVNLQDTTHFKRLANGAYTLAEEY